MRASRSERRSGTFALEDPKDEGSTLLVLRFEVCGYGIVDVVEGGFEVSERAWFWVVRRACNFQIPRVPPTELLDIGLVTALGGAELVLELFQDALAMAVAPLRWVRSRRVRWPLPEVAAPEPTTGQPGAQTSPISEGPEINSNGLLNHAPEFSIPPRSRVGRRGNRWKADEETALQFPADGRVLDSPVETRRFRDMRRAGMFGCPKSHYRASRLHGVLEHRRSPDPDRSRHPAAHRERSPHRDLPY